MQDPLNAASLPARNSSGWDRTEKCDKNLFLTEKLLNTNGDSAFILCNTHLQYLNLPLSHKKNKKIKNQGKKPKKIPIY